MDAANASADALRKQILATEADLARLKAQLAQVEASDLSKSLSESSISAESNDPVTQANKWPLSLKEYKRYGRQMIVPNIGIQGQLRLKASSVLIIGAGGLGCPAAAYIAGAGVGRVGIMDGDVVEISNLHRQILHSSGKVGMKKVDSAIEFLEALNPNVTYTGHDEHLSPQNAEMIVRNYDVVLDCTDTPSSRYLISDTCILLQKPLISASALRTEGQLIVLNSPPSMPGDMAGGPCYRCVFPKPPPPASVMSCGDGGILGPVVGVMGVLQAVEAIKLITAGKLRPAEGARDGDTSPATMLLFSANNPQPFRSVRLRSRRTTCFACSQETGLSLQGLRSGSLDYALFCGIITPVDILRPEERVEAKEYDALKAKKHLLLDVREAVQFDICSIEGSINVPFSTLQSKAVGDELVDWVPDTLRDDAPIYVVCRLGNDSQVVVRKLKEFGLDKNGARYVGDIRGGLKSWKEQVDSSWPDY